jgi:hypothetical protein
LTNLACQALATVWGFRPAGYHEVPSVDMCHVKTRGHYKPRVTDPHELGWGEPPDSRHAMISALLFMNNPGEKSVTCQSILVWQSSPAVEVDALWPMPMTRQLFISPSFHEDGSIRLTV